MWPPRSTTPAFESNSSIAQSKLQAPCGKYHIHPGLPEDRPGMPEAAYAQGAPIGDINKQVAESFSKLPLTIPWWSCSDWEDVKQWNALSNDQQRMYIRAARESSALKRQEVLQAVRASRESSESTAEGRVEPKVADEDHTLIAERMP